MHFRAPLFAALLLLAPALAGAQTETNTPVPAPSAPATPAPAGKVTSVKGKIKDPTTNAAVPGVAIKLTSMADSADVHRATAKDDGSFEITGLGVHSYKLEATRLGYAPLIQVLRVTEKNQDLGVLALTPESIPVSGVTVTESPAPAIQKADTTEYRASAVKVHKEATAEDLVQKLPGVTMENGQVKAQGETVQNVTVNGRPFFGSDPSAAMRNLPADVVDRIQVYDKASDQAEFSGFDDNQSQKTMNFILKDQRAKFGKVSAGYGDQDRYQAGGNATLIHGATRLTAIGMSNNINQRNFSPQDLFGAMSGVNTSGGGGPRMMMFGGGGGGMRMGGGNIVRMGGGGGGSFDPSSFLVGQQNGVSTTHSGGLNYVSQWGKKLAVTSSFFANGTDNDNVQTLSRQYVPPQSSLAYYDQNASADTKSGNERFDARLEFTADSLNSVILQPRLYFSNSDATSHGTSANTSTSGSAISDANSRTFDGVDGNNLSNRLTLRHRFGKRGRNVSADINMGHNLRDGSGTQYSLANYYTGSTSADTLDQKSNAHTVTNSISTRIAFTEPLTKTVQAQLLYNPSLTKSNADARAFDLDPLAATYTLPDSALSNTYENRNLIQNGGLSVLWTRGTWKLLSTASYQNTQLRSEQSFPASTLIERTYDDVLPAMTLSGTFKNKSNLRLAWNTFASTPTVGQLQNVVNNSNPLSLTTGNPALRPTYNHSLSMRFSQADPFKFMSNFPAANLIYTKHPIANSTLAAPADTTVDGVFLAGGTQLTRPVNMKESWSGNLFGVYSRPLKFLKSIMSFNSGGSFTRTPTEVNGLTNVGTNYAIRGGAVLASNISQNLDFTLTYFGTYNISRYTQSASNRGDYYTHSLGLRFNAVAKHGIVVREEVNHNLQSGVPSAYGQDLVLWNTTLGKKFLKNDQGEIRVTATDVLEQNRSVSRSVTESYIQDSRDRTLGRYIQAVVSYSFK